MKIKSLIVNSKRILCIFLFIGVSICFSFSEVIKFRAHAFSFREKDDYTEDWKSWADWQEDNSLIVIKDNVMMIYGKHEEQFDVIEEETEYDDEGGHNIPYLCIDNDGIKCRFVLRIVDDESIQLYYRYNNLQYVYSVEVVQ